ncbi:hypothetical protein KA977_11735 [Candidatus Dependentiae bacterium]|nr:hypothetical protein [Candidatus Dependentiae bacterium]
MSSGFNDYYKKKAAETDKLLTDYLAYFSKNDFGQAFNKYNQLTAYYGFPKDNEYNIAKALSDANAYFAISSKFDESKISQEYFFNGKIEIVSSDGSNIWASQMLEENKAY